MSWQQELRNNIRTLEQLSAYYPQLKVDNDEAKEIEQAVSIKGVNIPKIYLEDLINSIARSGISGEQSEKELNQIKRIILPKIDAPIKNQVSNIVTFIDKNYSDNNPVKGLTQMYPDRVLVSPNYYCMNNCQWCFREKEGRSLSGQDLSEIFEYIAKHPEIKDVILTGGEPLLTNNKKLDEILTELRKIEHVNIIRFHTRAPVVLPSRIDDGLLELIKKHRKKGKPIYFVTQYVHPNELSERSTDAVYKLTNAGVMVLNQTPILRGINDDQETFDRLNKELIKYNIKPYYVIATIIKEGTNSRFYVPVEEVEELVINYASKNDGLGRPTVIVPVMGKKLTPNQLRDEMRKYGTHFRNTKRDI